MKVLITGVAGFIGYHLANSLLIDDYEVIGLDIVNDYYDPELKLARLDNLKKYNNFTFYKIDLIDRSSLESLFIKERPIKIINLAAQAGVRYSIENPYAYLESNLIGFLNLIEMCRHYNVHNFVYASSSSVYGSNKKIPFSIDDKTDSPIALYGATKKTNELIANSYSHLYGLNTTGLRYFTVYGPWGRPDMAMFIFTKNILNNKPIPVFNNGNMKRDFTYIDDIILGTRAAIENDFKCEIFNLGNNKSEELMDVIKILENELDKEAIIDFKPMQPGDVKESFSDITYSKEKLNFDPQTSINIGIPKFIKWYKNYYEK